MTYWPYSKLSTLNQGYSIKATQTSLLNEGYSTKATQ
jgi:hypothetical protein